MAALMSAVLAAGLALAVSRTVGAAGAVYTVADLRAALAQDPQAWVGRALLVRGTVVNSAVALGCPAGGSCPAPIARRCPAGLFCAYPPIRGCGLRVLCVRAPRFPGTCPAGVHCAPTAPTMPVSALSLVDAAGPGAASSLPLVLGPPDRFLTSLRRLPLIGQYVPGPQRLRWGTAGIYHVVLQATRNGSCRAAVCYQAVVPDAAPVPMLPVGPVPLLAPGGPVTLLPVGPVPLPASRGPVSFPAPIVVPVHTQPVTSHMPPAIITQHLGRSASPSSRGHGMETHNAARHDSGAGSPPLSINRP